MKVTVLFPLMAVVVVAAQDPPYEIEPASVELKVKLGVGLFDGVGTGVTTAKTGAVKSIVKDGTARARD